MYFYEMSLYTTSISQLTKYVFVFRTFFFQKTTCIWIGANCPTDTKTAFCFANIETGLIVYNIYSLKEIHVCTVYVKSS